MTTKHSNWRRISSGGAAATLLLAASGAWSASFAADQHLTGPDVVRYTTSTASGTQVLQGKTQSGGGCSFSFSGTVRPGDAISELSEVAYNPKTCQTEIEFTVPSGDGWAGASTDFESAGGGTSGPGKPRSGGNAPAYGGGATCTNPHASSSYYPREACLHSWMQDPPGIHVTEITNEVQWTPSGSCASAGRDYASWYEQHFIGTLWFVIGNSFLPGFTCQAVTSQSGVAWQNNIFCANTPTGVTIAQFVKGFANGTYTWTANWTKTGVCSLLLGFHAVTSP